MPKEDLYFKGQYHANKGDEQNLLTAISYFQKAVTRSPRYAQPYCGLAFAYTQLGGLNFHYFPPRERESNMSKAKAAALKALEIDDALSEAHTWLGLVKLQFRLGLGRGRARTEEGDRAEPEFRGRTPAR